MATKINFHSCHSWICHAFRQVGNLIFIDFHSWRKKIGVVLKNERAVSITAVSPLFFIKS